MLETFVAQPQGQDEPATAASQALSRSSAREALRALEDARTAREDGEPREIKRILVVDDDQIILDMVTEMLEALDYSVETATNGAEALAAVRRSRPDAVLLDLKMPVLDGWAFLQACSRESLCTDVPIVIMSGSAGDTADIARQLRARGFLTKPFGVVTLLATVQELGLGG